MAKKKNSTLQGIGIGVKKATSNWQII